MLNFLCPLDEEDLEKGIFNLMFMENGYGLGMTYTEVLSLDVRRFERLQKRLSEQLEECAARAKAKK